MIPVSFKHSKDRTPLWQRSKMETLRNLSVVLALLLVASAMATQPETQGKEYWYTLAKDSIQQAEKLQNLNTNVAKNLVFFLGDGMSISTVTAARILKGQQNDQPGEEGYLSWETFPHVGLSKTYNTDHQVPDSAGTATAYLCGVKAKMGVIGVDDNADRGDCASTIGAEVDSILVKAIQAGKSVGLITTARLTHATPSALYAHVPERDWEANSDIPATQSGCQDIALQFLENLDTKHVKVALGGGRKKFMPNTKKDPESGKPGSRTDGRDLTEEWVTSRSSLGKATYVWNQTAFDAVDPNEVDYLFGLFQDSHMQYDIHRPQDKSGEPSLEEMTEKAIQILQKNPKGFFLLVEGGRIDHGHHEGRANLALTDAIAMDKAVTKAKSMTSSTDTLTIVTADHSHTMSMVGYPSRGNPILGHAAENGVDSVGNDNLPYTTLSYANGPGAPAVKEAFTQTGDRPDIENVDTGSDGYLQQSLVPMKYETHAGDDVGIWADGPLAHLFHSTHEQHYIMHVMAYAACIDEGKSHCKPRRRM